VWDNSPSSSARQSRASDNKAGRPDDALCIELEWDTAWFIEHDTEPGNAGLFRCVEFIMRRAFPFKFPSKGACIGFGRLL
jgi:hypothetical protein